MWDPLVQVQIFTSDQVVVSTVKRDTDSSIIKLRLIRLMYVPTVEQENYALNMPIFLNTLKMSWDNLIER